MILDRVCNNCNKELGQSARKYCSIACQKEFQYKEYIRLWKLGRKYGNRGRNTRNLSGHVIRYIFQKYRNQCAQCGWSKIHPVTGRVPLEINHIDGNAENSQESNLILLCPNCHSLTPNHRNLNYGNGRAWRNKNL